MAASDTQIANIGLQMLGARSILNLTDDQLEAREMNLAFATMRDAELNRHRWRFSFSRVSLPALATTPDSDYLYEYQLPGDFIRLLEGGDIRSLPDLSDYRGGNGSALYSIEGRKILTNLPAPLGIRHIARITDTTQFTPAFDVALAACCAYQTCEKITQSTQKQAVCRALYKEALRDALLAQALELTPEQPADDTWMIARRQ